MIPIMIVDSNPVQQKIYSKLLGKTFELHFAADAKEGIEVFKNARPVLALVCADLPEASGIELTSHLRKERLGGRVKILLLSEMFDDSVLDRETAREMGADDLAGLPITERDLKSKIKTLLFELKQQQAKSKAGKTGEEREGKKAGRVETAEAKPEGAPAKLVHELDLSPEEYGEPDLFEVQAVFGPLDPGEIQAVGEEMLCRILKYYKALDEMDYYAMLRVGRKDNSGIIRKAFFRDARSFHPDRFALVGSGKLKKAVSAVFKRMSEGYQVLCNPGSREAYDAQLAGGGEIRYISKAKGQSGPQSIISQIKNPQARKFFEIAETDMRKGELKSAKMHLALAANLAPDDSTIQAQVKALKDRMDEQ